MHRKWMGCVDEWFTNSDVAVSCGECESNEYRDVIDDGTDSTDSRQPYQYDLCCKVTEEGAYHDSADVRQAQVDHGDVVICLLRELDKRGHV